MAIKLTKSDYLAIERRDSDYLNAKGADFYTKEDYASAIEYYHLAAAMGNMYAISNLGYCYMYARSIEKNMSLALGYFKCAAELGNLDAIYKLGNIYKHGEEGIEQDHEMAIYYYKLAYDQIIEDDLDKFRYPSLFFSLAKEHLPNGILRLDYEAAYFFLRVAKIGYERELQDGAKFREGALKTTIELLKDEHFDIYRDDESLNPFDDESDDVIIN